MNHNTLKYLFTLIGCCTTLTCFATQSSDIKQPSGINQTIDQYKLVASFDKTIPNVNGDTNDPVYVETYNVPIQGNHCTTGTVVVKPSILNTGKKTVARSIGNNQYALGTCNIFDIHLGARNIVLSQDGKTVTFQATYQYDISKYINHNDEVSNDSNCDVQQWRQSSTLRVHFDIFCNAI